jgi:zinc transporter 7
MEKSLRVFGGEDEGHSHSHAHSHSNEKANGVSSAVAAPSKDGLRSRGSEKAGDAPSKSIAVEEKVNATSKLS